MNLIKESKIYKSTKIISLKELKHDLNTKNNNFLQKIFHIKAYYNLFILIIFSLIILTQIEITQQTSIQAKQFGLGANYEQIKKLNDSFSGNVPQPIESINLSNFNGDKRIVALYIFLLKYDSPMAKPSIAKSFVLNADKNGFSHKWYILPAISGIESAFGKLIPLGPQNKLSYNAWGWSGGSKYGRWSFFDSWEDAITKVSKGFSEIYKDTDFVPEKMVARYCPPCALPESRGIWPKTVNKYSQEIISIYNSI